MDKDKREQAWKKWAPEFDVSANQAAAKCGFYAGYAAATAEGIPQADGWVDVKCSNCGKIVTVGNDADTPLPT